MDSYSAGIDFSHQNLTSTDTRHALHVTAILIGLNQFILPVGELISPMDELISPTGEFIHPRVK